MRSAEDGLREHQEFSGRVQVSLDAGRTAAQAPRAPQTQGLASGMDPWSVDIQSQRTFKNLENGPGIIILGYGLATYPRESIWEINGFFCCSSQIPVLGQSWDTPAQDYSGES